MLSLISTVVVCICIIMVVSIIAGIVSMVIFDGAIIALYAIMCKALTKLAEDWSKIDE